MATTYTEGKITQDEDQPAAPAAADQPDVTAPTPALTPPVKPKRVRNRSKAVKQAVAQSKGKK